MFHYKTFTSVPRFRYLRRLSAGGISLPIILALVMFSLLLLRAPGQATNLEDLIEPINRTTLESLINDGRQELAFEAF